MDISEDKTVFTFTKDMEKHTIELKGYNEVFGPKGGFSVIEVASIDLECKTSENTGMVIVAIFLKNHNGSIIAKDFIFDFKDTDKLVFEKKYFNVGYTFKIVNGGV